ncbi:MAG: MFS transporter [Acidimicrobiales bacterium]
MPARGRHGDQEVTSLPGERRRNPFPPLTGEPTLRALIASLYAPAVVNSLGQGAVIPVIALMARHVGASVPLAGAIVGMRGLGTMLGDLPAGALVARLGDRRAVLVSAVVLMASGAGAATASSPWALAASVFAMGVGWAVWSVSRLSYATEVLPALRRGRGIATLGGASRIGSFVGPLLGAVVISSTSTSSAFWMEVVAAALACGLTAAAMPRQLPSGRTAGHRSSGSWAAMLPRRAAILGPGLGALLICALRTSRQALLPLWASHIGVDAAGVSLVFAVSSGLDMLLFAPAGWASDRWGRKVMAATCLAFLAIGHLIVPFTRDLGELMAVGLLLGFGNGVGSGIVMTMGADLSPPEGRAAFLGAWRFIADTGTAGGPFLLSGLIAVTALTPAALVVGFLGLVAAVVMQARMPEPSRRRGPASPAVPEVVADPAEE